MAFAPTVKGSIFDFPEFPIYSNFTDAVFYFAKKWQIKNVERSPLFTDGDDIM